MHLRNSPDLGKEHELFPEKHSSTWLFGNYFYFLVGKSTPSPILPKSDVNRQESITISGFEMINLRPQSKAHLAKKAADDGEPVIWSDGNNAESKIKINAD